MLFRHRYKNADFWTQTFLFSVILSSRSSNTERKVKRRLYVCVDKRMKKIFALILVVVLCASCFAGCSMFRTGDGMENQEVGEKKENYDPMKATPSGKAPGLYDSNTGSLKYSWAELEANKYITVKENVLSKSVNYIIGDLYIPNGILAISKEAFKNRTGLTGVYFGNGVTSVGASAFSGCAGLLTIEFGNGITYLGEKCFTNCTRLSDISIPDSVTAIAASAFSGCTGLRSVHLGDGVTRVSKAAFDGCTGLNFLRVGKRLTYIGAGVFSKCEVLYNVDYNGLRSEWNAIVVDKNNNCLYNAKVKTLDPKPAAPSVG